MERGCFFPRFQNSHCSSWKLPEAPCRWLGVCWYWTKISPGDERSGVTGVTRGQEPGVQHPWDADSHLPPRVHSPSPQGTFSVISTGQLPPVPKGSLNHPPQCIRHRLSARFRCSPCSGCSSKPLSWVILFNSQNCPAKQALLLPPFNR